MTIWVVIVCICVVWVLWVSAVQVYRELFTGHGRHDRRASGGHSRR